MPPHLAWWRLVNENSKFKLIVGGKKTENKALGAQIYKAMEISPYDWLFPCIKLNMFLFSGLFSHFNQLMLHELHAVCKNHHSHFLCWVDKITLLQWLFLFQYLLRRARPQCFFFHIHCLPVSAATVDVTVVTPQPLKLASSISVGTDVSWWWTVKVLQSGCGGSDSWNQVVTCLMDLQLLCLFINLSMCCAF